MRRSSCRLPLAEQDTTNSQEARQVGHFRPDKCPCGLPWDECPWTRQPFRCPRCGAVSHNPKDACERYCARCHVFVDDQASAANADLQLASAARRLSKPL